MNIDERLAIGKKIYRNEISVDDAMKLYNVSRAGANNWLYEYRKSIGLSKKETLIPNKQEFVFNDDNYGDMSKADLINEIMKRDIEIERLKKGYTVKGVGAIKEFVTINNQNTK